MKKATLLALCFALVLALAACGSSDAIKGTWVDEGNELGTITWVFDGNGKCTYESEYFTGEGTYTITDSKVTIDLDLWDSVKEYDYTLTENSLTLAVTDPLSPDFNLIKK